MPQKRSERKTRSHTHDQKTQKHHNYQHHHQKLEDNKEISSELWGKITCLDFYAYLTEIHAIN